MFNTDSFINAEVAYRHQRVRREWANTRRHRREVEGRDQFTVDSDGTEPTAR